MDFGAGNAGLVLGGFATTIPIGALHNAVGAGGRERLIPLLSLRTLIVSYSYVFASASELDRLEFA